jgi:hypothetical protein
MISAANRASRRAARAEKGRRLRRVVGVAQAVVGPRFTALEPGHQEVVGAPEALFGAAPQVQVASVLRDGHSCCGAGGREGCEEESGQGRERKKRGQFAGGGAMADAASHDGQYTRLGQVEEIQPCSITRGRKALMRRTSVVKDGQCLNKAVSQDISSRGYCIVNDRLPTPVPNNLPRRRQLSTSGGGGFTLLASPDPAHCLGSIVASTNAVSRLGAGRPGPGRAECG